MGDQWELSNQGYIGGPMRWGTNENCLTRVTLGDQWDEGPLRWGTNESGGSMRWGTIGIGRWWGDDGKGGPMRWGPSDMGGTNEMGDQWAPIMYWGTNELGDQWEGDQWDGGPMRWGTSERIPSWVTRGLFLCLFPELRSNEGNKHKNNTRVSAETVRHESTCTLFYFLHDITNP